MFLPLPLRVHYCGQPAARATGENAYDHVSTCCSACSLFATIRSRSDGNQASGDSYVAATLEAVVKEPNLLALVEHPRIALYQVFSRIWNSLQVNGGAEPALNLVPAERHLGQITAMPRQAFLLVSVEGFSEEDAAAILDVDQQTLQDLVDESGRELAVQIATDVLIIEGEMVIALDLEQLVENLGHRTIGIARTRAEAIELSRVRRPGLILADIQLADGSSGLEAVNDLLNSFEVVTFGVIVVTLVGQGLLLPGVVRWLGLASHAADEQERERKAELAARSEALKVAQRRLEQLAADRELSPEVLAILRARHDYRAVRFPDPSSSELEAAVAAAELRSELIAAEREYIYGLLRDGQITDEARRRIERELDLEEAGIVDLPL
jgi:CheY-like chemotaxis protein